MKKMCRRIMLIAMAVCLLCCTAIVPVLASDEIYVDNWDYLKQLLTGLDDDEEITIVITQNITGDSDDPIEIEADDCTINLKARRWLFP